MSSELFKLVTVICEAVLAPRIVELTTNLGASGFTMTDVKGGGPGEKIKVEIVVTSELSNVIMREISNIYFSNYSIIVYSTDITVIRRDKFEK